jgi:formylglycine-generating enzyme required for sulfatase activity
MVWIPDGEFSMGSEGHYPDEAPVKRVEVPGFWIEPSPVTNTQFASFVEATGHVTGAEVAPRIEEYPGAMEEDLVPGSLVFKMTDGPVDLNNYRNWWHWVPGADWRHPTGPDSSIEGLDDHPVVHTAHADAAAYASWAGKELPGEAEWEYAARGGLDGAEFVWGDEDSQETDPKANTWQGPFPFENSELDGWTRTSPVGSYEANGYGLFDMAGNVWEWTEDWYNPRKIAPAQHSCCAPGGLKGGTRDASFDPATPEIQIPRKVIKGGSHLCTIQYCFRYRPAARQPETIDSSTSHLGFRSIKK